MNAHRVETVLAEDGTLKLHDLPFKAGDAVEIIIVKQTAASGDDRYSLRNQVIQYDYPTEPVAEEDWHALQ